MLLQPPLISLSVCGSVAGDWSELMAASMAWMNAEALDCGFCATEGKAGAPVLDSTVPDEVC